MKDETRFRIVDSVAVADHPTRTSAAGVPTSIDKAFDVCEALSLEPGGMSLSELSRALKLPRPSVHRLLTVLRRRGYVRQEAETQRYGLGLKTLDLSFRMLGRSELRMHAYPALRDYAVQSGCDLFLAVPSAGEVTAVRRSARSEVALSTDYGREMPAHCVRSASGNGRPPSAGVSCLRLTDARDVTRGPELVRREAQARDLARLLKASELESGFTEQISDREQAEALQADFRGRVVGPFDIGPQESRELNRLAARGEDALGGVRGRAGDFLEQRQRQDD